MEAEDVIAHAEDDAFSYIILARAENLEEITWKKQKDIDFIFTSPYYIPKVQIKII